jgi:hypothetical protein
LKARDVSKVVNFDLVDPHVVNGTTTRGEIDERPFVIGFQGVEFLLPGRVPLVGVGAATRVREGGRFGTFFGGHDSHVCELRARHAMCGERRESVEEKKGDHILRGRDDTVVIHRPNGMERRACEGCDVAYQARWRTVVARGARDGQCRIGKGHVRGLEGVVMGCGPRV